MYGTMEMEYILFHMTHTPATAKGGIIKQGIPVVTGEDKPEPLKAIKRIAELRSSKYLNSYEYTKVSGIKVNDTGSRIWITTPTEEYKIDLKLIGTFQVDNARTTITALESIDENISRKEVEKGLSNARWPGRMDVVRTNPLVILDSSHNPSAAQTLSRSIREIYHKKPLLVELRSTSFLNSSGFCSMAGNVL